ncbi:hypothetical protein [Thauera humireducens]
MRDILITAIVLGSLPYIFRHAWIGVFDVDLAQHHESAQAGFRICA